MPAARIWTIGHSTRSAEAFIDLLRSAGITGLADVRTIPHSRRHPQFGRETLEALLEQQSVEYRHFADLGGLRKPRADSPNSGWKHAGFRGYADHMQTDAFAAAVGELLAFAERRSVAVMCAEALWWRCHRMLLSDALAARGVDVQHVLGQRGERALQPHRLTPFARTREDGRVWYPGLV